MFKLRSISARLILTISLTVAVACGVLGTFSIIQQRSLTSLALDQQLKLQYNSVMAALDYEGRAALAVSAVIANLPPVADAVAKGERDPLMALLQAPLAAIKPQGMPLISFQAPPPRISSVFTSPRSSAMTSPRDARPWWSRTRPASRLLASNRGGIRSA